MTPTERAKRSDALYYETVSVTRRVLCDMIANREADLDELRAELSTTQLNCDMWHDRAEGMRNRLSVAQADNAKLRELVADMNECLEHSKPLCKKCKFQERGCQWFKFSDRMRELGVDE